MIQWGFADPHLLQNAGPTINFQADKFRVCGVFGAPEELRMYVVAYSCPCAALLAQAQSHSCYLRCLCLP